MDHPAVLIELWVIASKGVIDNYQNADGRIRTYGTVTSNGFQDRHHKPLGHISMEVIPIYYPNWCHTVYQTAVSFHQVLNTASMKSYG